VRDAIRLSGGDSIFGVFWKREETGADAAGPNSEGFPKTKMVIYLEHNFSREIA